MYVCVYIYIYTSISIKQTLETPDSDNSQTDLQCKGAVEIEAYRQCTFKGPENKSWEQSNVRLVDGCVHSSGSSHSA